MAMTALTIWKKLEREMSDKYPVWSGINDMQLKVIVKNVHQREYSTDIFVNLD